MLRVLFVSHDGDLRAAAARALARAGCDVTAASHAGHASLACASGTPFDILVVEDRMPDATGASVAQRLRRYGPELRVVRMCDPGADRDEDGIAVVRPFTADDLIDAIAGAACGIPASRQTVRRRPTSTR